MPPESPRRRFPHLNKEQFADVEVKRGDIRKKLLVLTLALTLPLAQVVRADEDTDKKKKRKHQAEVAEDQRSQQPARSRQEAAGQSVKQPAPPVRPGVVQTQR